MNENTFCSTFGPPFLIGPFHVRQMPANANSGRGSSPLIANQCHVHGVWPVGSQYDDAGTRHRRCSNDGFQKLVCTLSSRVLVTRLGARPSWSSTKPQFMTDSSRSPSSA